MHTFIIFLTYGIADHIKRAVDVGREINKAKKNRLEETYFVTMGLGNDSWHNYLLELTQTANGTDREEVMVDDEIVGHTVIIDKDFK